MFEAGNILHGYFDLGSNGKKNKFVVVLYNDGIDCIVTTFTTSQLRSSVAEPVHGRNPKEREAESYVFKANVVIGSEPINNADFAFHKDTTIVPDYGLNQATISIFNATVSNLKIVCKLSEKEYEALIYTLYLCKRTKKKYKILFEEILKKIVK